ncbi:MAG: DUF354 domain-containing protein [Bacteroidales bacterium]|nr:DUF354 domain-containing protein [Bacteroidales bacterium]
MKILIDIGHPAHVHLFKNFARIMQSRGHLIHFTIRKKEFEAELLKHEGFSYTNLGRHYRSKWGKISGLIRYNLKVLRISLCFKPDIFLSHGSLYNLIASRLLRRPNLVFEDTGNREQVMLYLPFATAVFTSSGFPFKYGRKQFLYDGYHELAYLHPNQFKPGEGVLKELGVSEGERLFILRFVSWDATHDKKQKGLTPDLKRELINLLSAAGKVFISSEAPLPPDFNVFRFPLQPEKMHHALAYASLYIGEGLTMASEAAILGTRAVCINDPHPVYSDLEETYRLICYIPSGKGVLDKVAEMIADEKLKTKAIADSSTMLKEKIDVTAFMVWLVENYPDSVKVMQTNPEYQKKFKDWLSGDTNQA